MRPEEYDVWLFDLDGTVVDCEPSYARGVFDRTGDRLGYDFSERQIEDLWHGLTGTRNDHLRACGIEPERFWTVFHDEEDPTAARPPPRGGRAGRGRHPLCRVSRLPRDRTAGDRRLVRRRARV
jgi:phosphoglycolate phosphatase-like HAD superfamily hydrolase